MTEVRDVRRLPRLGQVAIVAGPAGLRSVAFVGAGDTVPPAPKGRNALTDEAFTQVQAFLRGERRTFALPTDLGDLSPFTRRVLDACARIPWGAAATYRDVAVAIGQPGAVRAVGGALGRNPLPILIPCHRVLACGGLGGYTPGVDLKRVLLAIEGHPDDAASMASAAAIPAN